MLRFATVVAVFAVAGCQKPPPAGAGSAGKEAKELPPGTMRFAVIGDFGADTPDEAAVARLVKSWEPAFVVTMGDNNYPSGEQATIDVNIGKYYSEFIGNYAGAYGKGCPTNRFWPCPGNHDWITPDLGPYRQYFTLPGNERYYDVDLGLVHLYALDSDRHEPDGVTADSEQAHWLQERLAASKSCFDIVYFHHPAYSTGAHGSSEYMRWPFHAWGAEVVLAGHDHIYERFEIDGIPYIVQGLGGASRYEFKNDPGAAPIYQYNAGYGATLVTASPTGIRYEFFTTDDRRRDSLDVPAQCQR